MQIKGYNTGELALETNENAGVDIYHNAVKRLETTSTGINVTGGIRLGGNNTANEMDDYEEGTWNPGFGNYQSGTGSCGSQGGTGATGGEWGQNGGNTAAAGSGGNGGNAISGSGFTVVGNNTNTVKGAI